MENHSWKQLSLIGDETVINLQRSKVYVFSDSVLCLEKIHQHPESNEAWKKRIEWIITDKSYRDYDGINGEPTEFEWNIFPGFTTLQLCGKVTDLLSDLGETPEIFTGRIPLMSMFNDISCDRKGNKEECLANAKVVSILAKKFGLGQWLFIGPGSGTVVEGWLGRGTTILHCTHRCITTSSQHRSFFSFCVSPSSFSVFFCCIMMNRSLGGTAVAD